MSMKIPYCKLCRKWIAKKHSHKFCIIFSQGFQSKEPRGHLGYQDIDVIADSETEALHKAYERYDHKVNDGFGYLPYYFINSCFPYPETPHNKEK